MTTERQVMRAIMIFADWNPADAYILSKEDKPTLLAVDGSKVFKNPKSVFTSEKPEPYVHNSYVGVSVRAVILSEIDGMVATAGENGYVLHKGPLRMPIIPGQEFAGVVQRMGNDISKYEPDLKTGHPVTIQNSLNCGRCLNCKTGNISRCLIGNKLGVNVDGALADLCAANVFHTHDLKPLSGTYSGKELMLAGALTSSIAGVYGALLDSGGALPGDSACVYGLNSGGLAAVTLFKMLGLSPIIAIEQHELKRVLALELGADAVFSPEEPLLRNILNETQGAGVTVYFDTIDTVNTRAQIKFLISSQSKSGRLVAYETGAMSTANAAVTRSRVAKIMGNASIDPLKAITRTVSIEQAPAWLNYQKICEEPGRIAVIIDEPPIVPKQPPKGYHGPWGGHIPAL